MLLACGDPLHLAELAQALPAIVNALGYHATQMHAVLGALRRLRARRHATAA
jgi:hypothetical protein